MPAAERIGIILRGTQTKIMRKIAQLSLVFLTALFCHTAMANPPDSIGVKKVKGKNYVIHRIEDAEGWFSIARLYGISYADLRLANKDSADKLIPGRTLLVPTDKLKANDPHFDKNYTQEQNKVIYEVKEGETLFSIAKRFSTSVDNLKKWNQLTDDGLKTGQQLIVGDNKADEKNPEGARPPAGTKKQAVTKTDPSKSATPGSADHVLTADSTKIIKTATVTTVKKNVKKTPVKASPKDKKEVNETGVASWIRDDDVNPNKYYALHRSAPIGTIIRVTNKMNSKYVFVKVVGLLPDTGDNTDLVIKISKASAEKLGVRDSRFQCELNYTLTEKP